MASVAGYHHVSYPAGPSKIEHLLCLICNLPIVNARQCFDCGCRICEDCYWLLKDRNLTECKRCKQYVNLKNVFLDKAITSELNQVPFPCFHEGCPWKGSSSSYRDHINSCKYAIVNCTHSGCNVSMRRQRLTDHSATCPYQPIVCRWCKSKIPATLKTAHEQNECPEFRTACPLGCEEKIARKMVSEHLEIDCKLQVHQCGFVKYGCTYKGNYDHLQIHLHADSWKHLELLEKQLRQQHTSEKSTSPSELKKQVEKTDLQLVGIRNEMNMMKKEMNAKVSKLSDNLTNMEQMFHSVQEVFQELATSLQVLQATSYNGEFIWKIPDVSRRRDESITGKTISLYSAPFYTSRFGYKLCLRLYMNGDGSGKGTHLSLFLTIMKGEYDALLQWPFPFRTTLMLLDQKGHNHITECFKADPTSSSFCRPKSEMNIASGCPKFASLSVLYNPNYVADDTMFFKTIIQD